MARRAARRNPEALTPDQQRTLHAFKLNETLAIQSLVSIEDRESDGLVTLMRPNTAQRKLYKLWDLIRALNILESLGPNHWGLALKYIDWDKSEKPTLKGLCYAIEKMGTSNVLYQLKKNHPSHKVQDGPVYIIVGKPRQVGISTGVQARLFVRTCFTDAYPVNVTAHKDAASHNVLAKSRTMYDRWPVEHWALRPQADRTSADGITFSHGSRFVAQTAGGRDAARSYKFSAVHLSESAHFKDYSSVGALLQAVHKRGTVIDESTANGRGGAFFDKWTSAMYFDAVLEAKSNKDAVALQQWNRVFKYFFSWFEDPEYRFDIEAYEERNVLDTLDEAERELVQRFPGKVDAGQLAWRRWKLQNDCNHIPGMTPIEYFRQEFPSDEHEMFQGQGQRAFNQEILARMKARHKDLRPHRYCILNRDLSPLKADRGNANLTVWTPPVPGHFYAIGVDVAKGLRHGDWSVITVFDRGDGTTLTEVARWRGRIEPETLGDLACLLGDWYNGAFITCESNDQGHSTNKRIFENQYPFQFRRKANLSRVDESDSARNHLLGMLTSSNSKVFLIGSAQTAITDGAIELLDPVAINEWLNYSNNDGRYGAPPGENDDCVMADAMAIWGALKQAPPVPATYIRQEAVRGTVSDETRKRWEHIQGVFARENRKLKRILGPDYLPEPPPPGAQRP